MKAPQLMTWTKDFEQEADTCDGSGETMQDLHLKQEDGGGGPFYVIQTDRWAFDYLEDLVELLARAGVRRRPKLRRKSEAQAMADGEIALIEGPEQS